MGRPSLPTVNNGEAGWDATINEIVDAIHVRPFPIARFDTYADLAAAWDPTDYEDCLVVVSGPSQVQFTSNGTNWIPV